MIEQYVSDAICEYLDICLELAQSAFILLKDCANLIMIVILNKGKIPTQVIEKQMKSLRFQI